MKYNKQNILYRTYFIGLILLLFALSIIYKLFYIQTFFKKENYEKFSKINTIRINSIKSKRGDIYDINNNLIATSIIKYNIYIDLKSVPDKIFKNNINSLCIFLENIFQKSKFYFFENFNYERRKGNQYFALAKNLDYNFFNKIYNFAIFNNFKFYNAIIIEKKSFRIYPFKNIGERTIGYDDYRGKIGLEGGYSNFLKGKNGKRLEQRINYKLWKPLKNFYKINHENGKDIYTTIDIVIQGIAYNILLKQLILSNASHGCIILMDVKSGEIRAMVNLKKKYNHKYEDQQNFSVWETSEPGSTFKPIAILAALEDKKININTYINTENKIFFFKGKAIKDSHNFKNKNINIKKIVEISSNIGMAKLIHNIYKNKPIKFINYLNKWGLNKKLNIDIPGEGIPFIPTPSWKYWNNLTLPWMSFGYNIKLTPLQILTFYNAIANNGKMLKPIFIKQIKHNGIIININHPFIINKSIASKKSLMEIQNILEGVVKNGTAKKYYNKRLTYAGKTGTTQLEYWIKNKPLSYNSSFVGYFPSYNPKYSCIVLVSKPRNGYYGSDIALPIFDKIAKYIYYNYTTIKK